MSRSPSSFFRSNRRSRDEATFSQAHRRTTSYGGTLDAPRPTDAFALGVTVQRSLSGSPNNAASARNGSTQAPSTLRGLDRLEKRRTMEERNFLQAKARSQNLNPPVDLRLLDYVVPADENLICPICRCPFVDPVVLTECDHCFCRDCIRQTWTTSSAYNPLGPRGDCPTCRTPAKLGPRSATSKILTNILDDLLVKCPKSDEGCRSQLKRGEVQDHINIYCGYAVVECAERDCELPVRRKDSTRGCLHVPVSCLACREEMQRVHLEVHWKRKCPDRRVTCILCNGKLYYRELAEHNTKLCPAISIPCPGAALGCNSRNMKAQAEIHAKNCTFAKMTPMFEAMKSRMDEQEAAQLQMNRKLEVLENGFSAMHGVLFRKMDDPDQISANPSSIPLLHGHGASTIDVSSIAPLNEGDPVELPASEPSSTINSILIGHQIRNTPSGPVPEVPGPRPSELPEPYSLDFDLASPFPPPATNGGPYVSPLHHMLSMHESLRDEMSRVSSALQELDGRHSMQILNENLRTREEMQYIGAQVAGLSRQVGWLTSTQLQRQSRTGTPAPGPSGDMAAAGPSVEAAISSAVRGAARMVNGQPMRRGTSEEGRTKL
ncbi:hypothetical protein AC578_4075 [Pseudocercospora eumusae]|uniref:RING-type domain-containing protein n=1 Tax=Pseudocercospora eumusae TaxID=321146 RepID=A0A139HDL9_9PEZI|nr:hypothetical protein AC578_4075 [Pseudocercospora eumusae]